MDKVRRARKRDINICAALSDSEKQVTFYRSASDPAVNTIDPGTYEAWKQRWDYDEKDREELMTTTLNRILEEHLPPGKKIDLLTIDVEGHELEVIRGLDLEGYRPKMIVAEYHNPATIFQSELYKHLDRHHYQLEGFATMNVYFTDKMRS